MDSKPFYFRDSAQYVTASRGTGKTHLAIALGLCALRQGYKVRF
ncbi:MAG: ATP-binding protein, partial [Moorella sp. (in: Bacteria)]|nr:ATP-binding protein [Moorella sp. (in: firmicutes)]